ncbi:unnamed protein product (mitochondrion) [Plasmodiophora brassicae]|uniref:dihydroneopterin aldolase n=1 Tax=Plasmodiophora brassicae TaxID=37360 RepID=A0A3P3YDL5_PLABS|nr:unnamed protein product [Plasmodiophora brassicae]
MQLRRLIRWRSTEAVRTGRAALRPGADAACDDIISLRGMVFHARHGVFASERDLGQKFVIDLEMVVDTRPAARSDSISCAVNYADVYNEVRDIVEGQPMHLIETVANKIAEEVLVPGVLSHCGVEICRQRPEQAQPV